MDNNTLKGRVFGQETNATRDHQGYWKIDVTIWEKVIYPSGEEIEEKIEASCLDQDFDVAHQIALSSALIELQQLVYDSGFDSLIEGKAHERSLEDGDVLSSEDNKNTPTQ